MAGTRQQIRQIIDGQMPHACNFRRVEQDLSRLIWLEACRRELWRVRRAHGNQPIAYVVRELVICRGHLLKELLGAFRRRRPGSQPDFTAVCSPLKLRLHLGLH